MARLAQTGFAVEYVDITFDVRHAYNINGFAGCRGINKFDADTCRTLFFMLTIDKATNIVFQRCNIAVVFIIQVFLCMGGAIKFIPSTGVTLPLISYGGSSVFSTVILYSVIQGMYVLNNVEQEEVDEKIKP